MKNIPRFFSTILGQFFSSQKLFSIQTPPFLPFYHVVSNNKLAHVLNYSYRNTSQFEKELDFFLKYFDPVSLEFLINNRFTKKNIFHLSFDDGLKECYEIIAPILKRKGIPATFFVNTEFVDNQELFHRYKASLLLNFLKNNHNSENEQIFRSLQIQNDNILNTKYKEESNLNKLAEKLGINFSNFLKTQSPYLTTIQILELQKQGFTIGAHSLDHPEFWLISEDEQYRQIKESLNWINQNIKPEVKAFAFPYTDDGASANVLKKIKAEDICEVTFGTAGVKFDELDFHFQRYPMEQKGNFVSRLKSEFVYFQLRKWIGKNTVKH